MTPPKIIIIGAGIGGLAASLRLSHGGADVTVLEAQGTPGGKMRTLPSDAGPVDAGPTVLTMHDVFADLFYDVGEALADHLTLTPLTPLARHYWDDGTHLDLHADQAQSTAAIGATFGLKSAQEFTAFCARTQRLFNAFDAPMMRHPTPKPTDLTRKVLCQPRLIVDMAPHKTLHKLLKSSFTDPRLVQLFGRYATYVGGSPLASPAILSLIWQAEAAGVWTVKGGMHQVATCIAALATKRGATFRYNTPALRITKQGGRVSGVETDAGHIPADIVLFNGDPRALATGLLGDAAKVISQKAVDPRSLSAHVLTFAAKPAGPKLAHHTVFFGHDPLAEFKALGRGKRPDDATLYICAQDHAAPPDQLQRFEIIRNAPPNLHETPKELAQCQTEIFQRAQAFGLTFDPTPGEAMMTAPQDFATLFPASQGSLYGRSPHGMMAAFARPTARTALSGLYLCGGGAHPGAGVPMATLSAQHAAAAIMRDLALTSTSMRTATHGGMSTA